MSRPVLFSSHGLPEVEQLADRVVIVSQGRLAGQGTLAELAGDGAVSVRTPQARLLMTALAGAGARPERAGPDSLRVSGMTAAEISRIARGQHIDLHELAASRTGLEQVFRTLTAGPAAEQRPPPGAGEPS